MTDVLEVTEADADRMMEELATSANQLAIDMLRSASERMARDVAAGKNSAVAHAAAFFAMLAITTAQLPPDIQQVVQTIGSAIAERVLQHVMGLPTSPPP